jgi:hypothetical protein
MGFNAVTKAATEATYKKNSLGTDQLSKYRLQYAQLLQSNVLTVLNFMNVIY